MTGINRRHRRTHVFASPSTKPIVCQSMNQDQSSNPEFLWYFSGARNEWNLYQSGDAVSRATVYENGIWHTWNHNGTGGENWRSETVEQAKLDAYESAKRQGFLDDMKQNHQPAWPLDRRQEFVELRDMLHRIASLNNGSNFLGKIQSAIAIAEKLTRTDFADRRLSFCDFLSGEATKMVEN